MKDFEAGSRNAPAFSDRLTAGGCKRKENGFISWISMSSLADKTEPFSKNESIKTESGFLRGTILEGLSDEVTGSLVDDDTQLTKFHGIYQQDDRDVRSERRRKKLEKAFSFMIRVRAPGGLVTPEQWLEMDRLADDYANGTLKLTTRQAFQFHGVLKGNLKKTIREINESLMDTIAACGDVNRNVMCNPNPYQSEVHGEVQEIAEAISRHLTPRTPSYCEIWLDGESIEGSVLESLLGEKTDSEEVEPIYGKTYLPRKFKVAMAVPPSNDVDVFAHDLGYVAIIKDGQLAGFTVTVGGGMGMTHGNSKTYPRVADPLGSCRPDQAVAVAEAVVKVQRDWGDRHDRKHARLKYTVEDLGLDVFREKVEAYLGFTLEASKEFSFQDNGDRYGWVEGTNGKHHLTLFVQNGRVKDEPGLRMKEGLREVARIHKGDFRLSPNQNLVIGNVGPDEKSAIEAVLSEHGILESQSRGGLRLNSMACVALPTCGLALAESERYLPDLVTDLESILEKAGLRDDAITIRMTGCPNGCARPYLAEIGFVGKAPGKYNLYLGAAFDGSRLNKLYRENVTPEGIREILEPMIQNYAKERQDGEPFGDFVIRKGIVPEVRVAKTDFHD